MLSKINKSNEFLATDNIKEYIKNISDDYEIIQDNLINALLIKNNKNAIYVYNYKKNKRYNHDRIQINFNDTIFLKQIKSFDQNNILIANKIRKKVLQYCGRDEMYRDILGIGGEYYLYFSFIKAERYFGISNHNAIIEDAKLNINYSTNYLVNYNDNILQYPQLEKNKIDLVILNVLKIHENIVKYIKSLNCKKIIIITCNLSESKLKLLIKNFKIKKINYFININNLIRVIII